MGLASQQARPLSCCTVVHGGESFSGSEKGALLSETLG